MGYYITIWLLTCHTTHKKHLTVTKTCTDPLCPVFKENEETSFQFLGKVRATTLLGYSLFGVYCLQLKDLYYVGPATLLRFAQTPKRFS